MFEPEADDGVFEVAEVGVFEVADPGPLESLGETEDGDRRGDFKLALSFWRDISC